MSLHSTTFDVTVQGKKKKNSIFHSLLALRLLIDTFN